MSTSKLVLSAVKSLPFIPTWRECSIKMYFRLLTADYFSFYLLLSLSLLVLHLYLPLSFIQSSLAVMNWGFNCKSQRSLIIENPQSINAWASSNLERGCGDLRCCFIARREFWAERISLAWSKTALTTANGLARSLSWWSRLTDAVLLHSPPLLLSWRLIIWVNRKNGLCLSASRFPCN